MVVVGVGKQKERQGVSKNGTMKVNSLLLFYYFFHSFFSSSCCKEDNDRRHCHIFIYLFIKKYCKLDDNTIVVLFSSSSIVLQV